MKKYVAHETRMDRSWSLHTALRKHCDSTPTSLAWNLFHFLPDRDTGWFYEIVTRALQGKEFDSPEALTAALKDAILGDETHYTFPARAALHLTFEMFDERDWGAYTCLVYEEKEALDSGEDEAGWVNSDVFLPEHEGNYLVRMHIPEHHWAGTSHAQWKGVTGGWSFKISPLGVEKPGLYVTHWKPEKKHVSINNGEIIPSGG